MLYHVPNTIEVLHTDASVKNKTNNNKHLIMETCQLHSMQLQKVKSISKQLSCKEVCSFQEGCCERSRWH